MGKNIDNHYVQIKLNEAVSLAEQIHKIINDDTVQSFVLENTDEAVSELLRWLKEDLHQINYSTTQSQNALNALNKVNTTDSDQAGEAILGKLTPDNTEDLYTEQNEEEHFGEEQAEGLADLLKGLRDGPHDNRW